MPLNKTIHIEDIAVSAMLYEADKTSKTYKNMANIKRRKLILSAVNNYSTRSHFDVFVFGQENDYLLSYMSALLKGRL